jgi:sec-independent protein translocase protein TatB
MPFGIGGSELIIIALLFLLIFGPSKLPEMARDIGRFVNQARRSIDDFKQELNVLDDEEEKPRRNSTRRSSRRRDETVERERDQTLD